MNILIIEDEKNLAQAVAELLKKENYNVDICYDGESGYDNALTGIYDLILLDRMLPKMNGIEVLKGLRDEKVETPILMLTAMGEIRDKVTGLDSGADDYLPKPFATEELLARIRTLLRRQGSIVSTNDIVFGDLALDYDNLTLRKGDESITLTLKECELLHYLIKRQGMITSKELILDKLWGFDSEAMDNHVEVYISFLRKKMKYLKIDAGIKTIRGAGYVLEK